MTQEQTQRTDPEYVLGTDDDELVRLGFQHRLWSACAHRIWERAEMAPGQRVLDVGCGPGFAGCDMAQIVRGGQVVGVDEAPGFVKAANDQAAARHLNNFHAIVGDVQSLDSLRDLEPGSFDIAYARWVLCFVPDPRAVIQGIARLLKPGGRVVLQDYFNYEAVTLGPKRDSFTKVIRAVSESWKEHGGDPDVMGRVPGIFHENGIEIEHLDIIQRISAYGGTLWHWPETFFRNYTPRLVESGFLTEQDAAAFHREFDAAMDDPDSFFVLPPVIETVGIRI